MAKKFARFFEVFFRAGTYIIWYINPISTGVLLQAKHPKKNSKKSPEDEEVQKIEFLCGNDELEKGNFERMISA